MSLATRPLAADDLLYSEEKINSLINVKINKIGGFANNCNFLLAGENEGRFSDLDGQRYYVLVTPAIDAHSHAAPIDFYLDKTKQQAPDADKADHRRDLGQPRSRVQHSPAGEETPANRQEHGRRGARSLRSIRHRWRHRGLRRELAGAASGGFRG